MTTRRAHLGELRAAVVSVVPYQRYSKRSVDDSVADICDFQGIDHPNDRAVVARVVRRELGERLAGELRDRVDEGGLA